MKYTWRTREDGVVVVRDGDGPEQVLTLSGPNAEGLERVESHWGDLCRRIGEKYGLPDGWLQAMIWRESGGNPKARNPETSASREDDGVGLMQITDTSIKAGHSDVELEDPEVNVELGAAFIASLIRRYGRDFPRVSAAYNAGSVHPPYRGFENPWNMHCSAGHITAEVSALNYHILRGVVTEPERAQLLALVFATSDDLARHDFERGGTEPPESGVV